jgi:hypothetical protein
LSSEYDADPDPDPAHHFDADPDPQHWLLPSARGDEAESLGLYGDTGALDMLLHVPVDKGRFPRRMVPWRGENYYHITETILDPAQGSSKTDGGIPVFQIQIQSGSRVLMTKIEEKNYSWKNMIFFL